MLTCSLTALPVRPAMRNRPRESVRTGAAPPCTPTATPCSGVSRASVTVPATALAFCRFCAAPYVAVRPRSTTAIANRFRTDETMAGPPFATGRLSYGAGRAGCPAAPLRRRLLGKPQYHPGRGQERNHLLIAGDPKRAP